MTGVQTCALPIYDTATTEIYTTEDTLSLHDALPLWRIKDRILAALAQCSLAEISTAEPYTEPAVMPMSLTRSSR